MIAEPNCSKRNCVHFLGVKQDNMQESTERVICEAFRDGIPNDIAYGKNLHLGSVPGDNGIHFEEEK